MKWISVEDRMPNPNKTVFVCNAKKYKGKAWLSSTDQNNKFPVDYITHWMPLPQPPGNGGGGEE